MSSEMDYEALEQALNDTIASLSAYQIARSSIRVSAKSQLVTGGFGDVQLATLRRTGQSSIKVALKKLRPAGTDNPRLRVAVALARETKIWSRLQHPNVVPLVGFYLDVQGDVMWLLSKWESLGNIIDYLATNDVDQAQRLDLGLDTAKGLAYLHSRKPAVCHGDIKGANVLINGDKRATWCDFGLAKAVDDTPSGLTTTKNATRGTTRYFSPELLEEDTPHKTLMSDVWAWACVFVEVVTGDMPYSSARTESLVIRAIGRGELPAEVKKLSIPSYAKKLLARCWSVKAELRPTMTWCSTVLAAQTTNLAPLFESYCNGDFGDFPSDFKVEGDAWHAIRNPAVPTVYDCEFLPTSHHLLPSTFKVSPDGRQIAIYEASLVNIYDIGSSREANSKDFASAIPTTTFHAESGVRALCFALSHNLLVTGHENGAIQIWNLQRQSLQRELTYHRKRISAVTFVNRDTMLVSVSYSEDAMCTWDLETGRILRIIHVSGVNDVVGSHHHSLVFPIANGGRSPVVCDAERSSWCGLEGRVCAAAFMPEGRSLITGIMSKQKEGLDTWDLSPLLERRESGTYSPFENATDVSKLVDMSFGGPQSMVTSLAVSADSLLAASGSAIKGDLMLWSIPSKQAVMNEGR